MRSLVAALGLLSCSYVSAFGASHFVRWDGTGDFPTIQAAVDAAAEGDTILLSPGTFNGAGNVNVDSRGKGLFVTSVSGAATTEIDCEWKARAFQVHDNSSSFFIVSDVTITRGWGGTGGAIQCMRAAVELRDAVITESIACSGTAVGCVDGQAILTRCRLLRNTCVLGAPCYGSHAPVCEGFVYGGPVSAFRSTVEMIGNHCEDNAYETSTAQVLYAEDSSVELIGNRFYRNRTFDGGATVVLDRCQVTATANEFIENAAWTSGIHLIECSGEVRGNILDGNTVQVGLGGIESEYSSATILFNFLRDNHGESIHSNRSTGDIARNLILRTAGSCCSYGTGIELFGCQSPRVANNTLFNNGVGSGQYYWASEIDVQSNSAWLLQNLIVHDEIDNVAECRSDGCSVSPPAQTQPNVWIWGYGALYDIAYQYSPCWWVRYEDPLFRDPAQDNFFLKPGSECDMDTTIGRFVIKNFYGALPKGSRPSGLLDITAPSEDWPPVAQPGTQYVLSGFSIRNTYRYDASVNYCVTSTSGLLRDGGNPLSLIGSTPVLVPGESFTPPPAVLEVPEGEQDVVVTYTYAYAPALNLVDTVRATIHFANPVSVRVTSFRGSVRDGDVHLEWTTSEAVDVSGWHVYRAGGAESFRRITTAPLPAASRSYVDAATTSGTNYRYRLIALDPDELIVGEIKITPTIPLALDQNTPNPFRTETTIRISTPGPARATLSIYGVDGALIRTLLDGPVDGDGRVLMWNGRDARARSVPSGVYFCRLTVGKESRTRKIVLAR